MGHPQQQPWRHVRPDDITNLKLKAEGSGAAVFQGLLDVDKLPDRHHHHHHNNTNNKQQLVALRKPRITSSSAILRFKTELELRSHLQHPNILPLLAACSDPPHYCTVSPWKAGGTLFDLIHTNCVELSFKRLVQLSLQLARAIAYLHDQNLVHRDLKTANILLDARWQNLVVADLDLLADVAQLRSAATRNAGRALHRGPSNGRLSHMVGTLVYMAPEVLSGRPHSFAADVYAAAITINEMAAAAVPFVDRKMPIPELHTVLETRFNEVKLRGAIVDGLRPVLATGVSPEFGALVERAWQHDPDQRPTAAQLVADLEAVLARGDDYLTRFHGSTLPSMDMSMTIGDTNGLAAGPGDGANGTLQRERTAEALIAEFRTADDSPDTPIWYRRRLSTQQVEQQQQRQQQTLKSPKRRSKPDSTGTTDTTPTKTTGLDVCAALSSTAGDRGDDCMEDRSIVLTGAAGLADTHLLAVFDGHGGQACSEFARVHFAGALFRRWGNEDATPESALVHAFEDVDYAFLNSTARGGVAGAGDQSGCTALAVLLVGEKLFVANAGDCRCVLGRTDGSAVALSTDHIADDPAEQARIEARGGYVSYGRAQGCLMVSRAFGDRKVKRFISASPDVVTRDIDAKDDFLVLASDGLWDVVSNDDAVALVQSTVRMPDMAAKRLALKAIELGSDDNISVIVAFLRGTNSYRSV